MKDRRTEDRRADALAERLAKGDTDTEGLISRLDSFLVNMEAISDRLMTRLDKLDEKERGHDPNF